MKQAQLDLQNQLEQSSSDPTTQPLFNDSPVLFLETCDQIIAYSSEQIEQTEPLLQKLILLLILHMKYHICQKRYAIMKDPVFLFSPIFPPKIPSQPSLSTTRDDHLIPLLSQNNFTFKAQLTSLYMHSTDYTFRLCDKIKIFLDPLPL